ncbi:MAG TPA: hypothetical protein VK464_13465 [Symbiobacteriaceae bacterium]|nr:hypothetical protein [Symbiobacteriaceae bacterium]
MPTYQLYRNGEPTPRRASHPGVPLWPGVSLSDGMEQLTAGNPVQLPTDDGDAAALLEAPQD